MIKLSCFVFLMCVGFSVSAQDRVMSEQSKKFEMLDTNQNGLVSADEIIAHKEAKWAEKGKTVTDDHKEKFRIQFAEFDANKDGGLDEAEFSTLMKKKEMKHQKLKEKKKDKDYEKLDKKKKEEKLDSKPVSPM